MKVIDQKLSLHRILQIASISSCIFLGLFSFQTNPILQGICIFIGSIGWALLDITINVAMLESHKINQEFWMQLNHGMFGIGGLLGPIIVFLF